MQLIPGRGAWPDLPGGVQVGCRWDAVGCSWVQFGAVWCSMGPVWVQCGRSVGAAKFAREYGEKLFLYKILCDTKITCVFENSPYFFSVPQSRGWNSYTKNSNRENTVERLVYRLRHFSVNLIADLTPVWYWYNPIGLLHLRSVNRYPNPHTG